MRSRPCSAWMHGAFFGPGPSPVLAPDEGMSMWLQSFDPIEAGRALGHDLYTQCLLNPQADWPAPVCEGFARARHAGLRRQRADRFVAKWLQLRMGAWRRGRWVADDVTPALLQELDVACCPVSRVPLTHGTLQDTDWSVDRLNNDAAYAASNLAVMSAKVNRAKGALGLDQVLVRAHSAESHEGLTPSEWLRLGVLMLGPTHALTPHEAPLLPLCAPLPSRSVRLAVQQIQRLLTESCLRLADKSRWVRAFLPACPTEAARWRLHALADAVHLGLKRLGPSEQRWDVWLEPAVMLALARWREALDEPSWARAAAVAGHLSQARRETPERLRAWQLPTRGYAWAPARGPWV